MLLDTIKPAPGTKLKFVGNKKYYTNYLTVGNIYEVYLYHKKNTYFLLMIAVRNVFLTH